MPKPPKVTKTGWRKDDYLALLTEPWEREYYLTYGKLPNFNELEQFKKAHFYQEPWKRRPFEKPEKNPDIFDDAQWKKKLRSLSKTKQ